MKKTYTLGTTAQAVVLVSLLLVASAVFLSQADKILAKAASNNIRGTIILSDRPVVAGPNSGTTIPMSITAPVALPGTACTLTLSGCSGITALGSSGVTADGPSISMDSTTVGSGSVVSGSADGSATGAMINAACTNSASISANGGIHLIKAFIASSPSVQEGGITYLAVAYDCTP